MAGRPPNPLGLAGFAFAEFTSPDPVRMAAQLEQFGFVAAARDEKRGLTLYRQGRIKALYESIELDQIRRGVITVDR